MRLTPTILGLLLAGFAVVYLGLLPWLSGDSRWVEGWIFGVWFVSFASAVLLWLRSRDPALLAERFRMPGTGGESRSDVAILVAMKLCWLAFFVVPPLDVRFGWTPRLPLWCEVCGGILLVGGSIPFFRAFTDNTYASQLVRIQTERGQHVIDTGVYGFVRHPMYLGASLASVGGALLLGSISDILIALALIGLLVARISVEENLLARDLEGYKEYREKVRYRLVPHVW
jgi:protein-S-isoprenylcysteine O-methyltransferase Ste14